MRLPCGQLGARRPESATIQPSGAGPSATRHRSCNPCPFLSSAAPRTKLFAEAARPGASQLLTELFDGQASPGDQAAERAACNLFMVRD